MEANPNTATYPIEGQGSSGTGSGHAQLLETLAAIAEWGLREHQERNEVRGIEEDRTSAEDTDTPPTAGEVAMEEDFGLVSIRSLIQRNNELSNDDDRNVGRVACRECYSYEVRGQCALCAAPLCENHLWHARNRRRGWCTMCLIVNGRREVRTTNTRHDDDGGGHDTTGELESVCAPLRYVEPTVTDGQGKHQYQGREGPAPAGQAVLLSRDGGHVEEIARAVALHWSATLDGTAPTITEMRQASRAAHVTSRGHDGLSAFGKVDLDRAPLPQGEANQNDMTPGANRGAGVVTPAPYWQRPSVIQCVDDEDGPLESTVNEFSDSDSGVAGELRGHHEWWLIHLVFYWWKSLVAQRPEVQVDMPDGEVIKVLIPHGETHRNIRCGSPMLQGDPGTQLLFTHVLRWIPRGDDLNMNDGDIDEVCEATVADPPQGLGTGRTGVVNEEDYPHGDVFKVASLNCNRALASIAEVIFGLAKQQKIHALCIQEAGLAASTDQMMKIMDSAKRHGFGFTFFGEPCPSPRRGSTISVMIFTTLIARNGALPMPEQHTDPQWMGRSVLVNIPRKSNHLLTLVCVHAHLGNYPMRDALILSIVGGLETATPKTDYVVFGDMNCTRTDGAVAALLASAVCRCANDGFDPEGPATRGPGMRCVDYALHSHALNPIRRTLCMAHRDHLYIQYDFQSKMAWPAQATAKTGQPQPRLPHGEASSGDLQPQRKLEEDKRRGGSAHGTMAKDFTLMRLLVDTRLTHNEEWEKFTSAPDRHTRQTMEAEETSPESAAAGCDCSPLDDPLCSQAESQYDMHGITAYYYHNYDCYRDRNERTTHSYIGRIKSSGGFLFWLKYQDLHVDPVGRRVTPPPTTLQGWDIQDLNAAPGNQKGEIDWKNDGGH